MAAPVNPKNPQGSVAFFQMMIDGVTVCSNMALPTAADSTATDAISGATATALVNILTAQRDLY